MNRVFLMGNLGADPELRSTQGGTSVASVNLATTRRVKRGEDWGDETEWHKLVAWSGTAETMAKHLKKGSKILVEGRLQTRKWQDKGGVDHYTTEIVVESFEFAGPKPDANGGGPAKSSSKPAPVADEEIPY